MISYIVKLIFDFGTRSQNAGTLDNANEIASNHLKRLGFSGETLVTEELPDDGLVYYGLFNGHKIPFAVIAQDNIA